MDNQDQLMEASKEDVQNQLMEDLVPSHDIEFINILGQEADGAICNVLRVGDIRIMFDCGCNESIDKGLLDIVRNEARRADYILLSHSTCLHVGALAYLSSQGISAQVIGTSPVAKIGAQTMHELFI